MDELIELFELLLVVDLIGVRRDGAQAIHDVVFNEHGGIAAHGEGDGVAGTSIDLALVTIGQYDNRRVEHRRLGANDLDALELGAQGVNEPVWMESERSGAVESDLLQRSRSTISDGTGPAAMTMVSMSTRTMEPLRCVAVNVRQGCRIE